MYPMNIKKLSFIVLLFLSLVSPLINNIISLANTCIHAIDFPIYQQAIYDSFASKNPNPFLTVRNIHILQDHFDPIYLLAGPWAALFNNSPHSLLFFEWLFVLATVGFLIRFSQNTSTALFWSFLLLWNRGVLHALGYPIHPTTWSLLPLTLTLIALKEKRLWLFWSSILSLLFFKEVFPLATLGLSLAFIAKKDFRKGMPLLSISILFCLFNFQWRHHLLAGTSLNYAAPFLSPWIENFSSRLTMLPFKEFFKHLLPGIIVLIWMTARKAWVKEDFFLIALWLPLFLTHTIAIKFGYHYGVLISWPLILLLWNKDFLFKDKWALIALTMACIYTSFGTHKRNHLTLFKDTIHQNCQISSEKRDSIKTVQSLIARISLNKTLLTNVGMAPLVLRPNAKIYIIEGFSKKLDQYDLLLLGRNSRPLNRKKMEQTWNNCLQQNSGNILFQDKYHLLIQGPVSYDCMPP